MSTNKKAYLILYTVGTTMLVLSLMLSAYILKAAMLG
jgi:hypothetical protein